jgi:hypothetical protein
VQCSISSFSRAAVFTRDLVPPRRVLIRPNGTAPARVPLLLREARVASRLSLSLSILFIYFELVEFIPLVRHIVESFS